MKEDNFNNAAISTDWFGDGKEFSQRLSEFIGKPNLNFLEIGSFNGNSAKFMLENILTNETSKLTCIDPWKGETVFNNQKINFLDVEKEFDNKMINFKKQIIKAKSDSAVWLTNNRNIQYDFIYIDGDHMPQAVMLDLLLSFKLLKPHGIMAMDDYGWDHDDNHTFQAYKENSHSAIAIDWFLQLYKNQIQIMSKNHKVWIRKIFNHKRTNEFYE